jgi:transposase
VRGDHDRPHLKQGLRRCLGILALTRVYGRGAPRLACRRGVSIKARSVASIGSILQNCLHRAFLDERSDRDPVRHPNLRGRDYYH